MCLEALERMIVPGTRVLDVGTGSGILVAAALLLGAAVAVGCDIDEQAIEVARFRVRTPLFVGSAQAVASGSFDIVVANISRNAAAEMFPDLERIAGRLILSGFESAPDLPRSPHESLERGGWTCLVY
jgi:ribosomal protein L11 methyltransferase